MTYYFTKMVDGSFDGVMEKVKTALKKEGFGVLTEIDIKATLKEKIGTMLPCNLIVQDLGEDRIEVAAINPRAAMEKVGNPALGAIADEVADKLEAVVGSL